MQLTNLASRIGKKRKRVGRGSGSGHGGTSCRGHKGQKARSGATLKAGFEGGQMPLYRKLPKRGFNNKRFKEKYNIINVSDLNLFTEGTEITKDLLQEKGLINKKDKLKLKVLGNGELKKKFTVVADNFSESARNKITALSGECQEAKIKPKEEQVKQKV